MRQLKFRAWNKDCDEMIYGDERSGISDFYFDFQGDTFQLMQPVEDDYPTKVNAIMMQFTGLKDKYGKELYEGDSVKALLIYPQGTDGTLETRGTVTYSEGYAAFGLKNQAGVTFFEHHLLRSLEIIGNIYEHPELIKP